MNEMVSKQSLMGLTREQLRTWLSENGEKPFRADQLMKWVHFFGVTHFDEMTNVSKGLCAKLEAHFSLDLPQVTFEKTSEDGTKKWLLQLPDGNQVETVFIPDGKRGTLCVSSQVGCALDCSFCSTGKQGFSRDLTTAEISAQVLIAHKSFPLPDNKGKRNVTNIVMMGMGEPLLNFDNVVDAMEIMKDDLGYGVAKKRLTLSTSGIVPKMYELFERIDVALAVSLHAPNDELRNQLVPVNKKYPLEQLMKACQHYVNTRTDSRKVTIEYVLLEGINDTFDHADELIELLRQVPSKINLIPFNPFPHSGYKKPNGQRVRVFQDKLIRAGYTTTVRTTRGDDIDAACGQLVGQVKDMTRRQSNWQKKIELKQAK
jgi:23S rRNA (adenine2503-C2)-methyltransferase